MEKNLIIRGARLEEKGKIQALQQEIFGWPMDDALFDRLFKANPAGESYICAVEDTKKGKIVGIFPLLTRKVTVGGRTMLASQPDYWMIAPEYRRLEVLRALHRGGALEMRRRGIPITYYFAPQAWAGYIKHQNVIEKWFLIGRVRWLARPLDVRPILSRLPNYMVKRGRKARQQRKKAFWERLLGSKLLLTPLGWVINPGIRIFYFPKSIGALKSNLLCREIESFDARFDELWEKTAGAYGVAIVRNRDYLNWKYSHHPSRHYRILCAESDGELKGYIVLLPGQVVRIMDLLAVDEAAADFLIRSAVAYASRQGSAVMAARLLERSYHLKALRRNGFYRVPEKLAPRGLLGLWFNLEIEEEEVEQLKDARNWFITEGDWDWSQPV